jgi:hypothetical protein
MQIGCLKSFSQRQFSFIILLVKSERETTPNGLIGCISLIRFNQLSQ